MQASRAKEDPDRQGLTSAADELKHLAKSIQGQQQNAKQSGQEKSDQQKQPDQKSAQPNGQQSPQGQQAAKAFAQANVVLARHFRAMADYAAQNKKPVMAGHDLEAATSSLEAALAWSGRKADQDETTAITDA